MKKRILLSLVAIATIALTSFGQAPGAFKYQAVVRDGGGVILNNQTVGMRLTIQQGSIGGIVVYSETFSTTSNGYGLVNIEIGTGTTSYDFTTIDWANGPFFMETATDITGGTSYIVMGTSQLMSVPYALYAKTAASIIEPIYTIGLHPELGGYVIQLSLDGKHGLVAETQDQGVTSWYEANEVITVPNNHSVNGKKYSDWRMPSEYELNLMFTQQAAIGGFNTLTYWCALEVDSNFATRQDFSNGVNIQGSKVAPGVYIRSVRAF